MYYFFLVVLDAVDLAAGLAAVFAVVVFFAVDAALVLDAEALPVVDVFAGVFAAVVLACFAGADLLAVPADLAAGFAVGLLAPTEDVLSFTALVCLVAVGIDLLALGDRKSTRLNSSH